MYEEVEMCNGLVFFYYGFVGYGYGNIMLGENGYWVYEKFDG